MNIKKLLNNQTKDQDILFSEDQIDFILKFTKNIVNDVINLCSDKANLLLRDNVSGKYNTETKIKGIQKEIEINKRSILDVKDLIL